MAKEPVIEFPEIEDDPLSSGPVVSVVVSEKGEGVEGGVTIEDGIEDLKQQLAEQRAENARLAAERQQARQEVAAARVETRDSNIAAVTNSIELTKQELTATEEALAKAMEAADFKTVAKLQRDIARNENKLSQLENGRIVLEQRVQQGERPIVTEGRVAPPARVFTLDERVEDLASRVTPASANWLRAHKQVMQSPEKLAAAHNHAVQVRGLVQDTPAYFAAIEADLGFAQPRAQQGRRPATVSAPAAREPTSYSNGAPQGRRIVNLNESQQDMARALDMSNEEYAKYLYEDQVARGLAN